MFTQLIGSFVGEGSARLANNDETKKKKQKQLSWKGVC
jgi:hypothetical protein